eukprot:SAG11_NODE_24095_length_378_cov_0.892473_1_plen_121_part_01
MQTDHTDSDGRPLPIAEVPVTLAFRAQDVAASLVELHSPTCAVSIAAGPDYGTADFWRTAPVLPNGWAMLGELDKWVGISRQRVERIAAGDVHGVLQISIVGAPGEVVHMTAASKLNLSAT